MKRIPLDGGREVSMAQSSRDKVARIRRIKDAGEAGDLEALLEVATDVRGALILNGWVPDPN
jgi:hypothetical protein